MIWTTTSSAGCGSTGSTPSPEAASWSWRPCTSTTSFAAYVLGIVDGPVYRLLEGRFDTGWARYSPGRLLEAAVVQRMLDDPALTTLDWMTSVASEALLATNDADPMVVLRMTSDRAR